MDSFNIIRYLSFEINRDCPHSKQHAKCPSGHPERYRFGRAAQTLDNRIVLEFWRWAKHLGFRGIVLFHMYNEPALVMPQIRFLMAQIKHEDIYQAFQLTTSIPGDYGAFDIVKISDYTHGDRDLDNRIDTINGNGLPYDQLPGHGLCGRGLGWEIPIDYYGNWNLCCGDWRCEESIGNLHVEPWDVLFARWNLKRRTIQWNDRVSYDSLPRLCRACIEKNPALSKRGGI